MDYKTESAFLNFDLSVSGLGQNLNLVEEEDRKNPFMHRNFKRESKSKVKVSKLHGAKFVMIAVRGL